MATIRKRSETRRRTTQRVPDAATISRALGASRWFKVARHAATPFGAAALAEEVRQRLVSRGGRPADPAPTLRRLIPIRATLWHELRRYARTLSKPGHSVSPGQLAAMLVERGVLSMEDKERRSAGS